MTTYHSSVHSLSPLAAPMSRQTAFEFVCEVLHTAILSGELAGGTRLYQAELASALKVSTTPVREALRVLASEGLVHFEPRRGAVVQRITVKDVIDIYSIRRILEPIALRRAMPNLTNELMEGLHELHTRLEKTHHPARWITLNRRFHMTIYDAGGLPRLSAIIRHLKDTSVMYVGESLTKVPGFREDAILDHGEILDALDVGAGDMAVDAVIKHLELAARHSLVSTRSPENHGVGTPR